ncbi:MAG: hypothetical protein MJ093_00295 [Saccharofermentans sp.]|nr:hypothetical protein [Saccharofermentans sp.]
MKKMKKVMAFALSCAMVMSIASCSLSSDKKDKKDKDEDEEGVEDVIAVADDFCSALKSQNAEKMLKVCSEDFEDEADDLAEEFDFVAEYGEEKAAYLDAIAGTIDYEIDEDSVEIKKSKATVDVVFTMADYESIQIDGFWDSIDSVVAAIEDADTMEVKTTIELEMDDDDNYVVVNPYDVVDDVMVYTNVNYDINAIVGDLASYVGDYYMPEELEDTDEVYMYLYFTYEDGFLDIDHSCYYVVLYNGANVYTSDTCDVEDTFYYGSFEGAEVNDEGHLLAGTYQITVYDMNDMVLAEAACEVTETASSATNINTEIDLPDGDVYVTSIDYTQDFLDQMGGFDAQGNLELHMYLILGDDEATLMLSGDDFKANVSEFMVNNLDAIFMASAGMSAADLAEMSGMTMSELEDYFVESVLLELDASQFDAARTSASYEIDGSSIVIHFPGSDVAGTISGNTISLDVSDIPEFETFAVDGVLTFEMQ